MAEGFKLHKRLTAEAEDLIIRANVQDADGGAFRAATFEKSRIDYITEVTPEISGIVLKTGARIAVAMPHAELEKKIYFADLSEQPVLDLRERTGAIVKEASVPAASRDFAAAVEPEQPKGFPEKKPFVDKPLKMAVFVRQASQQNFQMFFVMDTNIDWSGVTGDDNGLNGKMTKLPLRYGKGPFGETEVIIDMPRPAFMEIYNKAKLDGLDELDLRDWTRRRDPDKNKPPPRRAPELG
ncbi:MAG: hypothetical protein EPN97_07055 [Alphaproteobacteria bacterium]|nr:MAG: hypothetical protein EPN97_07055 [Alphaproteobacteria bacterium]